MGLFDFGKKKEQERLAELERQRELEKQREIEKQKQLERQKELERLRETYLPQLAEYRYALETVTGIPVKEAVLYLFGLGKELRIE